MCGAEESPVDTPVEKDDFRVKDELIETPLKKEDAKDESADPGLFGGEIS